MLDLNDFAHDRNPARQAWRIALSTKGVTNCGSWIGRARRPTTPSVSNPKSAFRNQLQELANGRKPVEPAKSKKSFPSARFPAETYRQAI
jgi:hypothetical protein